MEAERKYNYLDVYRRDAVAERYMLEPIVINWSNIQKVEILDEVKGWDQSKLDRFAGTPGNVKFRKCLVKCTKHQEFFQLMEDEPGEWTWRCRHCVTEEINRVLGERFLRDRQYEQKRRANA